MKRILYTALTAISVILITPSTASAQQLFQPNSIQDVLGLKVFMPETPQIAVQEPKKPEPVSKPNKQPKPKREVYTVVEGDNLTKIGKEYKVEWQRLWAKNKQLKHPDVIHIGDKITIPFSSEKLKRPLPAVVSLPVKTPGVRENKQAVVAKNFDGGNTYDYGYCTWYVKNRRGASLPNGLGNANTWYSRAAAMGMSVGSTPRAGAVGTTTRGALGHVVYVESVNKDGSINISEMNAPIFGKTTYRTAQASEFVYIY